LTSGPEARREAQQRKKKGIFLFLFQRNSNKSLFLSNQKSFSGFGVKRKVARNFVIFNFAKKSKAKIQIDFEL
jgi:hypothetical protein